MKTAQVIMHFKSAKIEITPEHEAALRAAKWESTKNGWKRPSVTANIPAMDVEDVAAVLTAGGAASQYLVSVLNEQFYIATRAKLSELLAVTPTMELTTESVPTVDWDSMAAEFIAAQSETRSTGIPKELWDEFEADYVTTMLLQMPDKGEQRIKNAAAQLKARFNKCKSNKNMVESLRNYLAIWFAATSSQAEFASIYESLNKRAELLLLADNEENAI